MASGAFGTYVFPLITDGSFAVTSLYQTGLLAWSGILGSPRRETLGWDCLLATQQPTHPEPEGLQSQLQG